jgi:uncharacterized protein YuzE
MTEIEITKSSHGGAYLKLADVEVRDSVALDSLPEADSIPALGSIVLDFDHYGRLAGIEIVEGADSALPPRLLEPAGDA